MTGRGEGSPGASGASGAPGSREESATERKRRLDRIFGEVLPEQTSDDADPAQDGGEDAAEQWLRRQVPPHHG